jgi:hypothetical protein
MGKATAYLSSLSLITHSKPRGGLTDEWATNDAGPTDQGLWLDEFTGRVEYLGQTVSERDGQDRMKDLIERLGPHVA